MHFRFLFPLFFIIQIFAVQVPAGHVLPTHPTLKAPWFTGPLLAPSGLTIPPGHINIEPYVFVIANIGRYDSDWKRSRIEVFWNNYFQPNLQVGINKWMAITINPILYYNYTKGAAKWAIGDIPFTVDFQLYARTPGLDMWNTALKLSVQARAPVGKYQRLDPRKKLTDAGGGGAWAPGLVLVWGNLFYIGSDRFITWRNALSCAIPNPVYVKNLNYYGGGAGTKGKVYPGVELTFDTAIEVTLSQNWVFSCDFVGYWVGKNRFKGETAFLNTSPSSIQLSMAPAFEYSWSSDIGIIIGSWFTAFGRNSAQFVSAVAALNYFY